MTESLNGNAAHNIILFIGDGMGISTVTAARIRKGQAQGGSGEDHQLEFEKFPFTAFSKVCTFLFIAHIILPLRGV